MKYLLVLFSATLMPNSLLANLSCESFTSGSNEDRIISSFDAGSEGPSIGDVRVGSRALLDANGNEIGRARWIVSPLGFDDEGVPTHFESRAYHIYSEGVIAYVVPNSRPRTSIHTADPTMLPDRDTHGIIVGGTGAFQGASGVVTIHRTEAPSTLEFNYEISCD